MTAKEIFYEMLKPDGKSERLLKQYEALQLYRFDPVNAYLGAGIAPGKTVINRWGVTVSWPEDHPGQQPITTENVKVLKDITHWRDYVTVPDIENNCQEGWEECAAQAREMCGEDKLLCAASFTGIFEQCHFLMGFADTLTALVEHPQEMHELIDCICDFKLKALKLTCEKLHPDAVFFHDDWGAKTQLFMKSEMWREFFKEPYRKIYGYIRSQGLVAIHHADSYLAPIVEDMAEIGIQCWQGVLPENDIPALQERLAGRMILMGGIGAAIDTPDSTEEQIRKYVRGVLNACGPGGHFIPSITYGLAVAIFPHVDPIINDEIDRYNAAVHLPKRVVPIVRRTAKASAAPVAPEASEEEGTISAVKSALIRGQKNKVVTLVQKALDEGRSAAEILNDGLSAGMQKLGEDFSAGKAFVPELLMAAKCMNEAMPILKPLLSANSAKVSGKAVIGTVRGDLHDIGKNIVRIMLEGCGIEVVDLGVDVKAEDFVRTAKEQGCSIIACSSLLTTSMNEMARVVELAKAEGIREDVTIMVGGAPITQEFCDAIGADLCTPDAAACARKAAELLGAK